MFLKGTPTWRFHTKLYKFRLTVFPNISHLKYFTDLILGKGFCIFIFFHFPDSSPSVLNGLHFYFSLRDSASREYGYKGLPPPPGGTFELPGAAKFLCEAGQTPPYSGHLPFFSHDIHKARVKVNFFRDRTQC